MSQLVGWWMGESVGGLDALDRIQLGSLGLVDWWLGC